MTIKTEVIGNSTFYINKTKDGNYNYNRVNEVINKTFNYKSSEDYERAIKRAKKELNK
jgi:hypothetical protein